MAQAVIYSDPASTRRDRGEGSMSSSQDDQHQHRRAFSQDGSPLLEGDDGDEVFSNTDTADLEESRSDATGTTSPAPNSPGPSSPSNRGANHIAIVTSQSPSDAFGTLKQNEYSSSQANKNSTGPLSLATLPHISMSQLQRQLDQDVNVETPRATTSAANASSHMSRPQYGRTISASNTTTLQASPLLTGQTSRGSTPRIGGPSTSHSTSYVNLASMSKGQSPLPSAHDMPSNAKDASTMSKLFARPPAQSPSEEFSGFAFNTPRDSIATPQGMIRSATGSQLNSPVSQMTISSPIGASRVFRSRPTTRPPSPERISAHLKGVNAGLGLGVFPKVLSSDGDIVTSSEPSIFERDIEHRDAGHVLSKQEAVDVAIPSVLDDAVEAITSEDIDDFEIVAPHASPPPLALSTQALSAHASQNNSRHNVPLVSSIDSPAHSPSPPLSSSAGGAVDAPPGSMAAQIAERLATRSNAPEEQATSTRHRRPVSDVSISSSSSMRSRSPQAPLSIGVQQVLDANTSPVSPSTPTAKTSSSSPTAAAVRSSSGAVNGLAPASTSTSYANLTQLSAQPSTPKPNSMLPTATALPSLPLPNPYRTHSPSTTFSPLPDGGMPMTSSVSMDGAIMTTSESATMDASLSGLADIIATGSKQGNSPLMKTRGLPVEEEVTPYSNRSVSIGQNLSPKAFRVSSTDAAATAALNLGLPEEESLTTTARLAKSSTTSSNMTKKRLSFFSYADIINHTPAEVMDLDTAVRQTDEALQNMPSTAMNRSLSIEARGSNK